MSPIHHPKKCDLCKQLVAINRDGQFIAHKEGGRRSETCAASYRRPKSKSQDWGHREDKGPGATHYKGDGCEPKPQHQGESFDLEDVVKFLCGEASLEGLWFADRQPGRSTFWWRKHLRAVVAATIANQQQLTTSLAASDRRVAEARIMELYRAAEVVDSYPKGYGSTKIRQLAEELESQIQPSDSNKEVK